MSEDEHVTRGMERQLAERRRRLARDDRGLGWKLGFGTPAAMEKLGIDAPLVGYLLQSARLESRAVVDISNWDNPRLEPEIVARVGEDGGIAAIGAAIELIDLDPPRATPRRSSPPTSSSATSCSGPSPRARASPTYRCGSP